MSKFRKMAKAPATADVVVFTLPTCGPCRTIKDRFAKMPALEARIHYVDVTEHPDIAEKFDVERVPTAHRFVDGEGVIAYMTNAKVFESWIDGSPGVHEKLDLKGWTYPTPTKKRRK